MRRRTHAARALPSTAGGGPQSRALAHCALRPVGAHVDLARLEVVGSIVQGVLGPLVQCLLHLDSRVMRSGFFSPASAYAGHPLRFPPKRGGIDNEDCDVREENEVRPGVP